MNLFSEMKLLAKAFSRWLYPASCAVCESPLPLAEDDLCAKCSSLLEEIRHPACPKCGIELIPYGSASGRCRECRTRKFVFDETLAIFRYDKAFRKILHQIKFRRKFWLLRIFDEKIRHIITSRSGEAPTRIVPIPLDRRRLRERTFNQSLLIAQMISKTLQIPVLDKALVRRQRRLPQSWLSRKERFGNLENLFQVRKPGELRHQWILLVDDVVTTGATVQECSKVLKESGARKVTVFALARTPSLS